MSWSLDILRCLQTPGTSNLTPCKYLVPLPWFYERSNFIASIIIYKHYNVFRINIIVNRNVFSILIPIRQNRLSEEKTLTEVRRLTNTEHIASYSGFFTDDRKYNSNLFFWFFPSTVSLLLLFLPRISFFNWTSKTMYKNYYFYRFIKLIIWVFKKI